MRSILFAGAAASLMVLGGAAAMAADVTPPPAADWSGFYIGIGAGYASYDSDASIEGDTEFLGPVDIDEDGTADTALGAAFIGYDAQVSDSFVVGAEVLGSIGDAKHSEDFFEEKYDASIVPSVRAGFLASDDLLLYGRAGWAFTHAKIEIKDNGVDELTDEGAGVGADNSDWIDGPQIGVGAEFRLTESLNLGIEGDYTWYDSIKVKGIDPNDTNSVVTAKSQADEFLGLVRLSLHL